MLRKDLYIKIIQFIIKCINDNSVTVINSYQKSPNTKKPFIMVTVSSITNECKVIKGNINSNGKQDFLFIMNANVRIECFSDQIYQASELLETVKLNFDAGLSSDFFKGEIAYVRDLTGVIDLPTNLSSQTEYRSAYDFVLRYNTNLVTDNYLIKHIEITDEVNDDTISIDNFNEISYTLQSTDTSFEE